MLDHSPILTKSATSFFGFLCGDILAQKIVGDPFDYARMVRLVLFGIFMDGPVGELPSLSVCALVCRSPKACPSWPQLCSPKAQARFGM